MNADEIRDKQKDFMQKVVNGDLPTGATEGMACMLLSEIAAQMAELNSNLDSIANSLNFIAKNKGAGPGL